MLYAATMDKMVAEVCSRLDRIRPAGRIGTFWRSVGYEFDIEAEGEKSGPGMFVSEKGIRRWQT
jgi:hypothetical protein